MDNSERAIEDIAKTDYFDSRHRTIYSYKILKAIIDRNSSKTVICKKDNVPKLGHEVDIS